jgi:hypothetical protein
VCWEAVLGMETFRSDTVSRQYDNWVDLEDILLVFAAAAVLACWWEEIPTSLRSKKWSLCECTAGETESELFFSTQQEMAFLRYEEIPYTQFHSVGNNISRLWAAVMMLRLLWTKAHLGDTPMFAAWNRRVRGHGPSTGAQPMARSVTSLPKHDCANAEDWEKGLTDRQSLPAREG